MTDRVRLLINRLASEHRLEQSEYLELIEGQSEESTAYLAEKATAVRRQQYGNTVFIRGLIEISNICKNDCYYCGIRKSNTQCSRYRLKVEEILDCCREGYGLGFRTFVLQGGEDSWFTDERLVSLISSIKAEFPDCAITLSLGERSEESYHALRQAGADRYLLRHETATKSHYQQLHPPALAWEKRMECLQALRRQGFQVGCGFMVQSPGQTAKMLAKELKFIEEFKPDMCGIGPFIPHQDTMFRDEPAGSVALTCYLLSCIRLIHPEVLLPSTTALGSLAPDGREQGILAGANVVMPNLSPKSVRKKYTLYNNKLSDGDESAQAVESLRSRIAELGYQIVVARGDIKRKEETHGNL